MRLIFLIAWRNLLRHKGKSLIIGLIFFIGALFMTFGEAVSSGMERGVAENLVDRFVGHLVIASTNTDFDNVITTPMGKNVSVISGYSNIKLALEKDPGVASFLPACRGGVMVLNEKGESDIMMVFGVDFTAYQRFFKTNLVVVEGRMPEARERAVLVNTSWRSYYNGFRNFWITPEGFPVVKSNLPPEAQTNLTALDPVTNMVLLGLAEQDTASDIRLPVRAVFRFGQLNEIWHDFNFIDLESFRECFNYTTGADSKAKPTARQEKLLKMDSENLDNLFGSEGMVDAGPTGGQQYDAGSLRQSTQRSGKIDLDAGSYSIVFVKLKGNGKGDLDLVTARDRLNRTFKEKKIDARAILWTEAAGGAVDFLSLIRVILLGVVTMIFLVGAIVISNTLSMSAIERTAEIGMMRAVGARTGFVVRMFIAETVLLSVLFAGLGMAVAIGAVRAVAAQNITTSNMFLQVLFGGDTFRPQLTSGDIIGCLVLLVLVTAAAVLYPVLVARRITPLEAIARE